LNTKRIKRKRRKVKGEKKQLEMIIKNKLEIR